MFQETVENMYEEIELNDNKIIFKLIKKTTSKKNVETKWKKKTQMTIAKKWIEN